MRSAWLVPLLLIATAAVYWPGLSGDFLFDDYPNILTNPKIHIPDLSPQSLKQAASAYSVGGLPRPLATTSFAVDYHRGQSDPQPFKQTNLLVHVLNVALVFLLLQQLLARGQISRAQTTLAASTIALLWATHPLQISTVLYVVQRMESMSLSFVLLGLIGYCFGRKQQISGKSGGLWVLASFLLAAIGLLAKESAALFPAFTLALELSLFRFQSNSARSTASLKAFYGLGCLLALGTFVLAVLPRYTGDAAFGVRDFTAWERLSTQPTVLLMYLSQMLLPLPGKLLFYYDHLHISADYFSTLRTTLASLALFGLLVSAFIMRKGHPLYTLGILWFFAAHIITSNVIPLELAFEHRNYFALLGILLAVYSLVERIPTRDGPAIKRVGIAAIVLTCAALGTIRAATWGDPFLLATTQTQHNPESARASNDMATLYAGLSDSNPGSPFYYFAMSEFERGSQLERGSALAQQGLILLAADAGQEIEDQWWQGLIRRIRQAPTDIETGLAVSGIVNQRANVYFRPHDDLRLSDCYVLLAQLGNPPPHVLAGFADHAITHMADNELALTLFTAAVEHEAANSTLALQIVETLISEGHAQLASAIAGVASAAGLLDSNQE